MRPDYEIIWRLSSHDRNQWVDSYVTYGTEHEKLMTGRCADFLQNCLKGFGQNLKDDGNWIANVHLSVSGQRYWITHHEFQPLLRDETYLVMAVECLLKSWAVENNLTFGSGVEIPW